MVSDDPSLVRYMGGRKFALATLFLLCSFALALLDKLTPIWGTVGSVALGAFVAANVYIESQHAGGSR